MTERKRARRATAEEKVLVINDNGADYGRIRKAFRQYGSRADLLFAGSAEAGFEVIEKEDIKAVFVNEFLPDMDGFNFLRKLKKLNIDLPVIMVLSSRGEKAAGKALRKGASDCVMMGEGSFNTLPFVLDRAVARFRIDRQRRDTEALIKGSQQLWVSIIDGIRDYIFIVDDQLKIFRTNRSLSEAFAEHPRDIIGKDLHELFGSNSSRLIGGDYEEKGLPRMEERTIGDETYLIGSFPLLYDKKQLTICVMKNISEMKRLKEQLYHSSKLASLGLLISGIAHEINNPLTGIITYAEILKMKAGSREVGREIMKILEGAERCKKVIRNLLTFSRQNIPSRTFESLNEIVDKAVELRGYWLSRHRINVFTEYDEIPRAFVDFQQLQQVIFNIVLNAEQEIVRSATQNGWIRITTKYDRNNDTVVIRISDNGPGIPGEILSKIFDPFFSTKQVGAGTGLGLSISHGIVAEHGGTIRAESQEGKGATFIIEIPCKGPDRDVFAARQSVPNNSGNEVRSS
jgi:signal transduction histidine kinase